MAKIFDEKKRGNKELDFQWKEHKDNAVDFQVRLLDLYKGGMKDFLEKEIRGISNDLFKYETDIELHEKKKHVLLLDKNFDIKEVFDEETFEDNHRVLKEVVQLLQKYRIRYPRKQQHLSDFFERLLTTGLKQEAGQFFTPPPITRFIVRSLPISQYIKQQLNQPIPELPAVIDYSVGSGHFLTEVMEEYQRAIEQDIDTSTLETQEADDFVEIWRKKKYDWASKYVYGIEKDYRLVKVAKVGCYFYGDGLAQIIHGDGLDNFKHSKSYRGLLKKNAEKPQFSFIVSNPPYSVSSFKGDLKNSYANEDFELFDSLTDRSSEIECLFIERTKQLLKTDGIAAIILPSSILTDTGIATKSREIILKYFDIIAITELGTNTFLATPQRTITLFLKRRKDTIAKEIEETINKSFSDLKDYSTSTHIEKPIVKYLSHVWEDISFNDYKTLLQKKPNDAIKQHEIFKEYDKKTKAKKEEEKLTKIVEVEKEKLLYFILSYKQKIVLIKTGEKKKEKQFLGYEFSNRRGNEGMHPIQRSKTIDECTQLYDTNSFDNENRASTYIYKAFTENKFDLEIPEPLKENISYQDLVSCIDFETITFEKFITLSPTLPNKVDSKFPQEKIENILIPVQNTSVKIPKFNFQEKGKFPVITQEKDNLISGYVNINKGLITDIPVIVFGDHSCVFKYIDFNFFRGADGTVLLKTRKNYQLKYVYFFLKYVGFDLIKNKNKYERHFKYLKNIKIPMLNQEKQHALIKDIEFLQEKSKTIVVNNLDLKIKEIILKEV